MNLLGDVTKCLNELPEGADNLNTQKKITELLNLINSWMINSVIKIKNELSDQAKKKKKKIGEKKFNRWWDSNIKELHKKVIAAYINYKTSNFGQAEKKILVQTKKEFRLQKRFNLALKRNRIARQLNNLYKLDKQMFWNQVKKMQQSDNKVEIPLDKLKKHYESAFSDNDRPETYQDMYTKKSNSDISNLRPVAISDCMSNLFEATLLDMLNEESSDHHKQFGFKKNSSCQHAIWTAKQGIEKCIRHGKWAYTCAIDASKAFDKVNRVKLWKELILKKLSRHLIISIIKYYDIAVMLVNNNNNFSILFKTEKGVRQGGKASPKLFSIYTEKFLERISNSDLGVKFNSIKIDILAYADDLLLISPTKKGLQDMLDIISKIGKELEIKFNPNKTVYVIFNKKKSRNMKDRRDDMWNDLLKLDGEEITRADSLKYLGVELNEDLNDINHIEKRIKSAKISIAKLKNLEILTEKTNPYLKGHLFKTYIMPVLHYGLENINLTSKNMKTIQKEENNLLRYTYFIPKRCRTSNLKLAINIKNTSLKLKSTHIEFFVRLLNNKFTQSIIKEMLLEGDNNDYVEQILRSPSCKDVLFHIREILSKKNTSFCAQLKCLEKRLFINCFDYELKIVKALIEFSYKNLNFGLVESVKFVVNKICQNLEQRSDVQYWYQILNNLLKFLFFNEE
ncbi:unnamed protein product [Brachionus calyciflorus]|uniref:Reverse transcriptase domain-containing protein n=1 Tax=Brachionus calyciflorus TaxID=104777 RepID=A0A814BTB9_9BILA|nr:unnamed protein product [Brachionus calyciflorus]